MPSRGNTERGYLVTFNGHRWNWPLRVPGDLQLRAVSCPSSSFCAAVGNALTGPHTFAGYTLTYDGRSWSTPVLRAKGPTEQGGRPAELELVACASRSLCVVTNTAGTMLRYNGKSWRKSVASYPTGGLAALACAAPTTCIALDNVPAQQTIKEGKSSRELAFQEAFALTVNGSGWRTAGPLPVTGRVNSLSCPTASFCLAVGEESTVALTFNGSSWGSSALATPEHGGLSMVSCASRSFCAALESEEAALTFNGSAWSTPTVIESPLYLGVRGLSALSCPSVSFCMTLDSSGRAILPGGRRTPAATWTPRHARGQSERGTTRRSRTHIRIGRSLQRPTRLHAGRTDPAPLQGARRHSSGNGTTANQPSTRRSPKRHVSARTIVSVSSQPKRYTVEGACLTGDFGVEANPGTPVSNGWRSRAPARKRLALGRERPIAPSRTVPRSADSVSSVVARG